MACSRWKAFFAYIWNSISSLIFPSFHAMPGRRLRNSYPVLGVLFSRAIAFQGLGGVGGCWRLEDLLQQRNNSTNIWRHEWSSNCSAFLIPPLRNMKLPQPSSTRSLYCSHILVALAKTEQFKYRKTVCIGTAGWIGTDFWNVLDR